MNAVGITLKGTFHFQERCLFKDLHFSLAAGQWTCLLGTSGVGKSTLLRLFAGLPTTGKFDGDVSTTHSSSKISVAYMAQSDLLYPWLNVRNNVILGSRLRGEKYRAEMADHLIEQVGLAADREKKPHELSGGMRQRVALARTLMEDTPVVLLDEPFSALDSRTRQEMQSLAFNVLRNKTVLLVTHDSLEALRLAHHLFVMTESGIHSQRLPTITPLRDIHDPTLVDAQASVLATLAGQYE